MQESQPSSSPTTTTGPSRGKLILALAISSFVLIPGGIIGIYYFPYFTFHNVPLVVLITFLIAPTLGISAWVLANRDLARMREGIIPASAHGVTKLGQTLGIFGAVGDVLFLFVFLLGLLSFSGYQPPKDAMINDLNNIAAHAYQYRVRPASMGGGEGSYRGYAIPAKMSQHENNRYTAYVLHADTLQFIAKSIEDSSNTIEVKIDSEGRLIASSWIYGGDFK